MIYRKHRIFLGIVAVGLLCVSCRSHYQLVGVERSRIIIDSSYDAMPNAEAEAFIAPYQHKVDSLMSPLVGHIAGYMSASRPESALSNLLADILLWGGEKYEEKPDFAVYNIGGIRAAFLAGAVTCGDVLEVAPFENKICFLTLTGDKVMELFRQIASSGGEGVSHGVELVISKDGQLISARLYGKEIDPAGSYRVSTLDYLACGGDHMDAFKAGTAMYLPRAEENNVRFIIMNYFREKESQGVVVDSRVEGRIVVVDD